MTDAVSLRPVPFSSSPFDGAFAFARRTAREGLRLAIVGVGTLLVLGGFVLALLPGHLGLPLLVIGLILVLRNSPKARRQFIILQRRHPRFVFPVRRLIRREPEVFPVLWQQALRLERMILPHSWRRAVTWRRRYFRARRAAV
jgi:hypothetical protein